MNVFDQLQLRPHERRLVVIGGLILFVVLNMWFVWPHYGDLAQTKGQIAKSQNAIDNYGSELASTNRYLAQLRELERDGTGLLNQDADIKLLSTIQTQIRNSGLSHASIKTAPRSTYGDTNEFFEQQALSIVLNPNDPQPLVRFLVSLATNEVVLRVKDLDLKPDGAKQKLSGSLKVVASFQRESLAPSPPPASTQPSPRT